MTHQHNYFAKVYVRWRFRYYKCRRQIATGQNQVLCVLKHELRFILHCNINRRLLLRFYFVPIPEKSDPGVNKNMKRSKWHHLSKNDKAGPVRTVMCYHGNKGEDHEAPLETHLLGKWTNIWKFHQQFLFLAIFN